MRRKTGVLVVGAGAYGLGLALELFERKVDFIITGRYMEPWFEHTLPGMVLRSEVKTSSLYHPRFEFDFSGFLKRENVSYSEPRPPVGVFRQYLTWCRERLTFPVRDEVVLSVERLTSGPFRFGSRLSGGDVIESKSVVIATGLRAHRYLPAEFSTLRNVVHSSEVTAYEKITGKEIDVAGAGQSAFEIMEHLLAHENRVGWFYRQLPKFMNQPVRVWAPVFSFLMNSPSWFCRLPAPVRKAVVHILSATTVTRNYRPLVDRVLPIGAEAIGLRLLVSATGYRPALGNIKFLVDDIIEKLQKARGPLVDRNFESNVAGLYFIGAVVEELFGPAMRFITGSHYCARKLGEVLSR